MPPYSRAGEMLGSVEAERQYRPWLSNLVADPERGVWGSQEGELFQFLVEANGGQSWITYGRPDPAAISLDDLVLISPTQLAGLVVTTHLVRQADDGQTHDVAPARAPDGAPFEAVAERDGTLLLRSARSIWYSYDAATRRFQYAEPFEPAAGLAASDGAGVWSLVSREQLFRFDLTSRQFTLLGSPVPAGAASRPVGGLNGQLVVQSKDALALLDAGGRSLRQYPTGEPWRRAPAAGFTCCRSWRSMWQPAKCASIRLMRRTERMACERSMAAAPRR